MQDGLYTLFWYAVYTTPVFLIAWKSEHPLAWLAFVPLANIWLMLDMADLGCATVLLFLIPLVGAVIFYAMVWTRLAENTNKPSWLGLLMVIPVVDLFVGWYIATANT
jgi:hypothetical protein